MVAWRDPRSLCFALLLALSVSAKAVLGGAPEHDDGRAATKEAAATFLGRHGFRLEATEDEPALPFVRAVLGDCRLLVVVVSPQGWERDIVHRLAPPGGEVFFVADGEIHEDQPKVRTMALHYWRRLNRLAGRRLPARPVLGVVGSPGCDLRGVRWSDVTELP
jgi:hypothetical protein